MKLKFSGIQIYDILQACLILLLAGLLTGCAPRIPRPIAIEHLPAPADFPESYYRQAELSGSKILRIDSKRSLVTILVRRGGALSHLGHDHVVASRDVTGYMDITDARADLYISLDKLSVDEPLLRTEAGFTTQPSNDAIEGTRRNMLYKVLEIDRYPFALISVIRTHDPSNLIVNIGLHGSKRNFIIPAQIVTFAKGIEIKGELAFNQSDFGITPFSILGGALQVQDRVSLHFHIFSDGN